MRFAIALSAGLVLLTACGEEKSGFVIGQTSAEGCDLSLDTLDGTTWVLENEKKKRPQARVKFFKDGDDQKAKYTVASLGDVYEYDCEAVSDEEWLCREEPRLQDWCQALEAHKEGSCTPEKLHELGATGVDDGAMRAAIDKAREVANSFRGGDKWQRFLLENNNVGNKLQGLLYIKPNLRKCNLRITDNYMTVYNGERAEDSNVVGTDFFVKAEGEFLWEHCDDANLADLSAPEKLAPNEIPARREHAYDADIHYHYYGETAVEPEEGCSYSYDSYAMWRPVEQGVAVQPNDEGKLDWYGKHAFSADSGVADVTPEPRAVYTMVRYKTCGGEKQKIDAICNAAVVK